MKHLLFASLLLVGCGDVCEGSDYTIDKYDICVFDSELEREKMEGVVDRIHELYFMFSGDYKSPAELRSWYRSNQTIIEFTHEGLPKVAGGATNYDWSICDGWSWWITVRPGHSERDIILVLNHEFLHLFDHMFNDVRGELDNSHGTPGYFSIDSASSYEAQMLNLLWEEFLEN